MLVKQGTGAMNSTENKSTTQDLAQAERKEAGRNARKIARKALWKDFINNYYKAFAIALKNAAN